MKFILSIDGILTFISRINTSSENYIKQEKIIIIALNYMNLAEEERAGCFTLIVFLLFCGC